MSTMWVAPLDADGNPGAWQRLGVSAAGLQWAVGAAAEEEARQWREALMMPRTITGTIQLTAAQAHEWRWWLGSLARAARRPRVYGPRPLAWGCLPRVRRGRRRG